VNERPKTISRVTKTEDKVVSQFPQMKISENISGKTRVTNT
jgi:hypothetical protein|tara:strand:- start:667 stop:789 length:123 start_codon:yes stop_codon:yes gene_type:complete